MSEAALQLKTELGRLPAIDQAELAHFLLLSLHDDVEGGYDPQQDEDLEAELLRREQEVTSGAGVLEPAWKVMAELREKQCRLSLRESTSFRGAKGDQVGK
jgi:hypothetical protein